jgi:murein DD-endopeptidase MepM/ murein hydrolase activator NlpD
VAAERRLERQGVAARTALRRAFAPFPVGGLAVWSDTWGAPRYAGGYHPHHGQDLLCALGTPLLAVADGVVRLGSDPLGGTTIELTLRDGSFWYYAHLSRYAKGLTDGERVHTGDVIGACGETGDATVPHLHFSYFTAGMQARNPMHALIGWLHHAERRVGAKPSNGHGVPTPPAAELATPPEVRPRPAMATDPIAVVPAFVVTAPSSPVRPRRGLADQDFFTTALTVSTFDGSCPDVTVTSSDFEADAVVPIFTLIVITWVWPPLRANVQVPPLTAVVTLVVPSKYDTV